MTKVAFLDVDGTLLIKETNDDGTTRQIINNKILEDLQVKGIKTIYLFTNMDFNTFQDLKNKSRTRITRNELVKHLKSLGFEVRSVITQADPAYNRGIGKAFEDLCLPAQDAYMNNLEQYLELERSYNTFRDSLKIDEKYSQNTNMKAAGQKHAMFSYFLDQAQVGENHQDIEHIEYYDDDENCLNEVKILANEKRGENYLSINYVYYQAKEIPKPAPDILAELKNELNAFIRKRKAEKGVSAFFKDLATLNNQVKINAAEELVKKSNDRNAVFSQVQLDALLEASSELGGIVTRYCEQYPDNMPKILMAHYSYLKTSANASKWETAARMGAIGRR